MSLVHLFFTIAVVNIAFSDVRFDVEVQYESGGNSTGVCTGDFDNDGDLDVALANRSSDSITVLYNDGKGAFVSPIDFATGENPRYVVALDFDNDGDIDLCTPDHNGHTTSLLENDGLGNFNIAHQFETFTPTFVWIDDLDVDGHEDIIVLHWDGKAKNPQNSPSIMQPFYGNNDGTFTRGQLAHVGKQPRGAASADLNGDGLLDIVVADIYSQTISVVLSSGNREWEDRTSISMSPGAPRYIKLGDYDNDGDVDIAALDKLHGHFWILKNDGNAVFTLYETIKVNDAPHSMVVHDFNEDGNADFLVTHVGSESQFILYSDGSANIKAIQMLTITGGPAEVKIADLNSDGLVDIVTACANLTHPGTNILLQRECNVCDGVGPRTRFLCPPVASDINVQSNSYASIEVELLGESIAGNSLSYIVTSIPETGEVEDASGQQITTVPYYLPNNYLKYTPKYGFEGLETLHYQVNDCLLSNESLVSYQIHIPFPDECNLAQQVFNGYTEITTLLATNSSDAYDSNQCGGSGLGEMSKDIWLNYYACENGELRIDTCDLIGFDADIVVYSGSCCGLAQIACNGDTQNCDGYSIIIIEDLLAESDYFIRIGGTFSDSFGTGSIFIDGPSVSCIDSCFADLTNDGFVNVSDFLIVLDNWGLSCGEADLNIDGIVNVVDLLAVIGTWGGCTD
jgi:hypothetical protein